MLEKEDRVGNGSRLKIADAGRLEFFRPGIVHPAEKTKLEIPAPGQSRASSKFSSVSTTCAMNWSATAPSINR